MKIKTYNYFLDENLIFGEKRVIKDGKDKVETKGEKTPEKKTDTAPAKTDGDKGAPAGKESDEKKGLEVEVAGTLTPVGQEGTDVKTPTEEKPGEKVQKPSEKAKLPPGEGADLYDFVYTTAVGLNTSINSPFVQVMLQGCAWMAQHGGFLFDMFSPDRFMKSLDGEKLAKEEFTDKQKRLLKEQKLREIPAEFKLNDYKDLNGIEASTKYVSSLLFPGEKDEEITDPKILGARLLHWTVDEKKFYKQDTLKELNKEGRDIPKGTVIFFTEGNNGQLFTAYATGNRKEFIYFKPGLSNPQRFQLNAKDSPVQNEMALKAAFIPSYNTDQKYFAAHPQELSQDAYETTLAAIEKLEPKISETKKSIDTSLKFFHDFQQPATAIEILGFLSGTENYVKIAVEALNELIKAQHPNANIKKAFLIEQISIYRGVIKDFHDKYNKFVTDMKVFEGQKEAKEKELAALPKEDPKRKGLEAEIKGIESYIEAKKLSPSPEGILASLATLEKNADELLVGLNPKSEVKPPVAETGEEKADKQPVVTKTDEKKPDGAKVETKQPASKIKIPVKTGPVTA